MPHLTSIHEGLLFVVTLTLVMAAATTVQSAIGFGFNLLATPILVYLYREPTVIVPAMVLAWYPVGLLLCWRVHREVDRRRIFWWSLPAVPGVAMGVWLLREMDPAVIRRTIGAVTIVSAVLIAMRLTRPLRRERWWLLGAGSCSAVLAGSTGMSGPPVVLLGLNQAWPATVLRATLLLYFTLLGSLTLICLLYEGMVTTASVRMAAAGAPGLIGGMILGSHLARRMPAGFFRNIAIALLLLAGILPWM